jgi:sarcosine oxidase
MPHYDVIVIGLGAMGSSTLYHLASRGVNALGIERFTIPHAFGSSHGHSRMIRSSYYEHPDYVPLLCRSFELWDKLESEAGEKLLHRTGVLYMGKPGDEILAGVRRSAREHSLQLDSYGRAELRLKYPQFHVPDDYEALFETEAGFLLSERCINAHVRLARKRGATVFKNTKVFDWRQHDGSVSVVTDRGKFTADRLVFCAGAWTDKLVKDLGVPLVVTRQILGWVKPKRPELFQLGTLPGWMISRGDGSAYYGFPMTGHPPGFKLALHQPLTPADPDTVDRTVHPDDESTFRACLRDFIPDADGPVESMAVCMYTNSPDEHFILDRHPTFDRAFLACGFSGHGFKFSSVVGEAMADLATKGRTDLPIGFLSLSRFA